MSLTGIAIAVTVGFAVGIPVHLVAWWLNIRAEKRLQARLAALVDQHRATRGEP